MDVKTFRGLVNSQGKALLDQMYDDLNMPNATRPTTVKDMRTAILGKIAGKADADQAPWPVKNVAMKKVATATKATTKATAKKAAAKTTKKSTGSAKPHLTAEELRKQAAALEAAAKKIDKAEKTPSTKDDDEAQSFARRTINRGINLLNTPIADLFKRSNDKSKSTEQPSKKH